MALENLSYQQLVDEAEKVATDLWNNGRNLDTQLRKFYDYLLKVQRKKEKEKLPILRAKLAYFVARNDKLAPLGKKMEPWLRSLNNPEEDIEKLVRFLESVISFYKYKSIR